MPVRTVSNDGATWRVQPSGMITANCKDEFALIFRRGEGADEETRVVRYSPVAARTREASFAELTEADLRVLLAHSQPSATSPEVFYTAR